MPDVFISYKRQNEAKVAKLVDALQSHGLDVWWDREIPPGAPWEATIEHQLHDAKAVVVCWSKAAVESENVRSEARLARNQGRLIQVFLEPCEPPLFFGERQGIDLTTWRGKLDDPRVLKLAEAARAGPDGMASAQQPVAAVSAVWTARRAFLAAALALCLVVAVGWLVFKPGEKTGPITLAVLPFRALSAADVNLTDAIADDTRSAIGRNPNLRVLGRLAVTALAEQNASPQDFRSRVGADFLLDGSVQRDGRLLRIKVSLVRAKDAAEIWADRLDGRVDDVFAFQARIAREVEGRIRGRLAPNRGIKAENITTSGEVYAIYAEARAHNRRRNPVDTQQGINLLKKALAIDPNYAPAWAELGAVTALRGPSPERPEDKVREEAVGYVKRALILAPNLAVAHAALSMAQDHPPELEPELKKAVELDPNNAEAWNWLGTMYAGQNRLPEAVSAFRRANEIEPLLIAPIGNLAGALSELGDNKGLASLQARVNRTGDAVLQAKARFWIAKAAGHLGEAVRIGLKLRADHPEETAYVDSRIARLLLQLGFVEESFRSVGGDISFARVYHGVPIPSDDLRAIYKRPIEFWEEEDGPALWARLFPKHDRTMEFVGWYTAAFKSPDEFYNLFPSGNKGRFRSFAPNTAVLLRAGGKGADAQAIIARDEQVISGFLKNGPATGGLLVNLAQLRGAQERDDDAIKLIGEAFAKGWLPDRQFESVDIADEPCFDRLVKRADFQALRKRILDRIELERRIAAPAVAAAKF